MQTGRHASIRARAAGQSFIAPQGSRGSGQDPFASLLHCRCFQSTVLCTNTVSAASLTTDGTAPFPVPYVRKSRDRDYASPRIQPHPGFGRPRLSGLFAGSQHSLEQRLYMHSTSPLSRLPSTSKAEVEPAVTTGINQAPRPRNTSTYKQHEQPDPSLPQQTAGRARTYEINNVMRDLPVFKDDGLKLLDWETFGPPAETSERQVQSERSARARALNHKSLHPLDWEDLFEFHRKHTRDVRSRVSDNKQRSREISAGNDNTMHDTIGLTRQQLRRQDWSERHQRVLRFFGMQANVQHHDSSSPRLSVPQTVRRIKLFFADAEKDPLRLMPAADLDETIQFLLYHAQMPYALHLIRRIRTQHDRAPYTTHMAFMQAAAFAENLNAFERNAKAVVQSGYDLDGRAWILLLQFAPNEESKRRVIQEMATRGLLVGRFVDQSVIAEMLRFGLESHVDMQKGLDEFIATLHALYGATWISQAAVQTAVDVLASRGMFDECLRLLYTLKSLYQYHPSALERQTILYHHGLIGDMAHSIRTVRRYHELFAIDMTPSAFDALFRIAWSRRQYNVLAVVWKYARSGQQLTFHMRSRITGSLRAFYASTLRKSRSLTGSTRQLFDKHAGFMACTTEDRQLRFFRKQFRENSRPQALEYLISLIRTYDGAHNLESAFEDRLLEAWHLDQTWKRQFRTRLGKSNLKSLNWKLQYGLMTQRKRRLRSTSRTSSAARSKVARAVYKRRPKAPDQGSTSDIYSERKAALKTGTISTTRSREESNKTLSNGVQDEKSANVQKLDRIADINAMQKPLFRQLSLRIRRRWARQSSKRRMREEARFKIQERRDLQRAAAARGRPLHRAVTSVRRAPTAYRYSPLPRRASVGAKERESQDWAPGGWTDSAEV